MSKLPFVNYNLRLLVSESRDVQDQNLLFLINMMALKI